MLKDIEWLKEQIGLIDLRWGEGKGSEFFRGFSAALIITKRLINQLDHTEPLIIPYFVDDWLKGRKKDFKTPYDAMLYINSYGWDDETHIEFKLYKWIPDNVELFARAWSNSYMIEEMKDISMDGVNKKEYKIENAEDAEDLYQMGIKCRGTQIDEFSKHIIARYADSLVEGEYMLRCEVKQLELVDDLVANIGLVLGEKFKVIHLKVDFPYRFNGIEIKRKEEQ